MLHVLLLSILKLVGLHVDITENHLVLAPCAHVETKRLERLAIFASYHSASCYGDIIREYLV